MATATIKGGPELRARLAAVSAPFPEIASRWQSKTVTEARSTAPARTGQGRASIHAGRVSATRATVRGAFWLIFIDRGTKAHDIKPKSISGLGRGGTGTAKALRFEVGGKTIFAKKVHRKRMKRRPFLTAAARNAISDGVMAEEVVKLWNRRRRGRWSASK